MCYARDAYSNTNYSNRILIFCISYGVGIHRIATDIGNTRNILVVGKEHGYNLCGSLSRIILNMFIYDDDLPARKTRIFTRFFLCGSVSLIHSYPMRYFSVAGLPISTTKTTTLLQVIQPGP